MAKSDKKQKDITPLMVGDAALYQVQYNGERPFTVLVDESHEGTRVRVYKTRKVYNEEWEIDVDVTIDVYKETPPKPKELLMTWKNLEYVWVAKCPSLYASEAEALGNSLLLQLPKNKKSQLYSYIYINATICKFSIDEPITDFESPMGNNNVPYSAALSSKDIFFLGENYRLPRIEIKKIVLDKNLKKLPKDAIQWVCIYDILYGTEKEKKKWNAKGLHYHPDAKPIESIEILL